MAEESRGPGTPQRGLLERLPWLELVATVVLGLIFYFPLKTPDLAKLTWALGALQSLGKLTYEARIKRELQPVHKLSEIMDLSQNCQVVQLSALNQVYTRITEPEFQAVKDSIVREASDQLLRLANDKTSNALSSGEYYSWLLSIIDSMPTHSKIWALSLMLDYEWDDSPAEARFLESSISAAKRGVTVERVFIMDTDQLPVALENPAVKAQAWDTSPDKFVGFVVDRQFLRRTDPALFAKLGDGFIAFDRRVALIDLHSPDDQVRGQVTMNAAEIARLASIFDQLKMHSYKLTLDIAQKIRSRPDSQQLSTGGEI